MRLNKYSTGSYSPKATKIKVITWLLINGLFFRNPLNLSSGLKVWLLKLFGAKVGAGVLIKPAVNIKYPWLLSIADHVWIGENVWIDNLVDVRIESNVCISQGAMLLTGNHNYKSEKFDLITGEITVLSSSWIGAKSIICPGVTVHEGAVLTAGSVATKNLESEKIYQGNPARVVRERTTDYCDTNLESLSVEKPVLSKKKNQ